MINNHIFQQLILISLLAGSLVFLFRGFFRRTAIRPASRLCVWCILIVRLLIPFGLSLLNQNFTIDVPDFPIYAGSGALISSENPVDQLIGQPATALTVSSTVTLWDILRVIWLIGAAFVLIYQMIGYFYLRHKLLRNARTPDRPELLLLFADLCRELHIRRALPLVISPAAPTPLLLGFFRTRVLLPREDYSADELQLILRHELMHYRRRDLLFKFLLLFTTALHWFNPAMLFLRREVEVDMELACDEAVLRTISQDDRRVYTSAILSSIETASFRFLGLTTGFQGGAEIMKNRISAIVTPKHARRGRGIIAISLAVVLILSVFAGCVGNAFPVRENGAFSLGSITDVIRVRGQNVSVRYFDSDMTLDDFLDRFGLTIDEANPHHDSGDLVQSYRAYDSLRFEETGDQLWNVGINLLEDGRIRNVSFSTSFWGVPWEDAYAQAESILEKLDQACGKTITQDEWMNTPNYHGIVINDYGDTLESLSEVGKSFWREYLFMRSKDSFHITISRNQIFWDTTERIGEKYDEVFEISIVVAVNRLEL